MKIKRALNGRFSHWKHYRLPDEKIKPVLFWYYASLGVLVSCYLIGGAFYECFIEIKTKLYETRTIIIYPRAVNRADAVSGETESSGAEISGDNSVREAVDGESAEETIKRVAEDLHFGEVDNLLKIAKCESGFNPDAVNPTNNSYDRGVFQISRRWHPEVSDECAFDVACATEATIGIKEKSGWNAWMCASVL